MFTKSRSLKISTLFPMCLLLAVVCKAGPLHFSSPQTLPIDTCTPVDDDCQTTPAFCLDEGMPTGSDYIHEDLKIAADADGRVMVVWEVNSCGTTDKSRVAMSRSTDGGESWTQGTIPDDLNGASIYSNWAPQIATDGDGMWIVLLNRIHFGALIVDPETYTTTEASQGAAYSISTNFGDSWTTPTVIDEHYWNSNNSNTVDDSYISTGTSISADHHGNWMIVINHAHIWNPNYLPSVPLEYFFKWVPKVEEELVWENELQKFFALDEISSPFTSPAWQYQGIVANQDEDPRWVYIWKHEPVDGAEFEICPGGVCDGAGWVSGLGPDSEILYVTTTADALTTPSETDWSAPRPLQPNFATDTGVNDGEALGPKIAYSGEGNWIAAWTADNKGTYVSITTDDEIETLDMWSTPALVIPDDPSSDVKLTLSTNKNGRAFVIDSDSVGIISSDHGHTWSSPSIVCGSGQKPSAAYSSGEYLSGRFVSISVNPDLNSPPRYIVEGPPDLEIGSPAALSVNACDDEDPEIVDVYPVIAVDETDPCESESGNWITAWSVYTESTDTDIVYSISTDFGDTWSTPTFLLDIFDSDDGSDGGIDELDMQASGSTFVLVFTSNNETTPTFGGGVRDDSNIYSVRSTDGGQSWSDPILVDEDAEADQEGWNDSKPKVTSLGGGRWIAVWQSIAPRFDTGTDSDLFVAYSDDDGESWYGASPLNSDAATDGENDHDEDPSIAAIGDGAVVTWSWDLEYSVLDDFSNPQWASVAPIWPDFDSGSCTSFRPRVVFDDESTTVTCVWYTTCDIDTTSVDYDIAYVQTNVGLLLGQPEPWSSPQLLNLPFVNSGFDFLVEIGIDVYARMIAYWVSSDTLSWSIGSDLDVLHSERRFGDTSWPTPLPLNTYAGTDGGAEFYVDSATDSQGNWIFVWQSTENLPCTPDGDIGTDMDILFARLTPEE